MSPYKKNKFKKRELVPCPICGQSISVGFLTGGNAIRFFCNDCNIEYKGSGKLIQIYFVEEDGTLVLKEDEKEDGK